MCASTKQLQNQRRNLPCETNNTEFFAKYSASSLSVWQGPEYATENIPLITDYLNNSRLLYLIQIGEIVQTGALDNSGNM